MFTTLLKHGVTLAKVLAVAGVTVVTKDRYDQYIKAVRAKEKRSPIAYQNALYAMEYGIVSEDYFEAFEPVFKYMTQYRNGSGEYDRDQVVLSPLWVMEREDVSLLLAAALGAQHAFVDHAELFGKMDYQWNAHQMRYVSLTEVTHNDVLPYSLEDYVALVKKIRHHVVNRKEFRISRFIQHQAKEIAELLPPVPQKA